MYSAGCYSYDRTKVPESEKPRAQYNYTCSYGRIIHWRAPILEQQTRQYEIIRMVYDQLFFVTGELGILVLTSAAKFMTCTSSLVHSSPLEFQRKRNVSFG